MKHPLDKEQARAIWNKFDTNSSGVLEKDEISRFIAEYIKVNNITENHDRVLEAFMNTFDSNGNGIITMNDITAGAQQVERKATAIKEINKKNTIPSTKQTQKSWKEIYDEAFRWAESAKNAEKQNDLVSARAAYIESAGFFLKISKLEKTEKRKKLLLQNVDQFLTRAEELTVIVVEKAVQNQPDQSMKDTLKNDIIRIRKVTCFEKTREAPKKKNDSQNQCNT